MMLKHRPIKLPTFPPSLPLLAFLNVLDNHTIHQYSWSSMVMSTISDTFPGQSFLYASYRSPLYSQLLSNPRCVLVTHLVFNTRCYAVFSTPEEFSL